MHSPLHLPNTLYISPNALNRIKMNILHFSTDKGRPPMDRAVSYTEVSSFSLCTLLIKKIPEICPYSESFPHEDFEIHVCFFRFRCRTSQASTHNMPDTRCLTNTKPRDDQSSLKSLRWYFINKLCLSKSELFSTAFSIQTVREPAVACEFIKGSR